MKVLFVCLGNICRSPMAEAMFVKEVADAGLADQIQVASAATSNYEIGNRPHPGTRQILAKYDLDDRGHRARQITDADFDAYDYIIGMDDMNMADLRRLAPEGSHAQVCAINDHTPGHEGEEVPDPWYTHRFQDTYDSLNRALPYWLDYLRGELK